MNRRSWLLGLVVASLVGCASMQAKNVPEVIAAYLELSPTLSKLISDAGLTQTLSAPGPFTVFLHRRTQLSRPCRQKP